MSESNNYLLDVRDLENITWINESILDIPKLELGKFDYISCSGVLHHLKGPDEGLAILRAALKEDGAMTVMVYATYGRTGIYHVQDIMRLVNRDVVNQQQKVDNCKRILNTLPPTNWLIANKSLYEAEVSEFGDIGIYDLFLHSQDRAYTVPELYDFVEGAGLNIIHLFASHEPRGNRLYDPASYISDPDIRERMGYTTPTLRKKPALENLDNIPCLSVAFPQQAYMDFHALSKRSQHTIEIQSNQQKNKGIRFPKTTHTDDLFQHLDGKRSLKEIFIAIRKRSTPPPSDTELLEEFRTIFNAFNIHNWMLLRDGSVKQFSDIQTLQQNVARRYAKP